MRSDDHIHLEMAIFMSIFVVLLTFLPQLLLM